MSPLHSASVRGNRVAYFEKGSGPAVVLIHGMFGDHLDWEPVLELLSQRYRVIAPDLPGFGGSEKPDCEYTSEFFVDSLHDLLATIRVARATLIGNSFGGEIAILYALAHPAQVEKLILVSAGGLRRFSDEECRQIAAKFSEQALAALTPQVHEVIFAPIFARQTVHRQRYLEKQNAKLLRADLPAYARSLTRSMQLAARLYLVDRLPEIGCRTLLVWGDSDPVFPLSLARTALGLLPHGELVVVSGASHALQLDAPEEFVDAATRFISDEAAIASAR